MTKSVTKRTIELFDSTLRDGAQGEGVSYSVQDKLSIVKALDAFGVRYIEAGNPHSNPKDTEFFALAKTLPLANATLVAFGSTRRKGLSPSEDAGCQALLNAGTKTVAIFGKCSKTHVHEILKVSEIENEAMVLDTVRYFKQNGREVVFDAEHFFDGYKQDPVFAMGVLSAAKAGGADVLCLCDTNGGTLPDEIAVVVEAVKKDFPTTRLGIHCHNDTGCAVANSLVAVQRGAVQVQGTLIGTGERCGNTDLSVMVGNLAAKLGYACLLGEPDLTKLQELVLYLHEITNLVPNNQRPYTGSSAFAHKGGMHIDGVDKLKSSFEHVNPELVGNRRRYLMSEVSGRTTIIKKLKSVAPDLIKESQETARILEKLKELEHKGYQFESAEASFELLVLNLLGRFQKSFELQMYKTNGEYPAADGEMPAYALVKVRVGDQTETSASVGNGPVNALDLALRKALATFYPEVEKVSLTDYKVRVLSGADATAANVRVLIENTDGKHVWTTVGVSTDIIEASWLALQDSIEYYLLKKREEK